MFKPVLSHLIQFLFIFVINSWVRHWWARGFSRGNRMNFSWFMRSISKWLVERNGKGESHIEGHRKERPTAKIRRYARHHIICMFSVRTVWPLHPVRIRNASASIRKVMLRIENETSIFMTSGLWRTMMTRPANDANLMSFGVAEPAIVGKVHLCFILFCYFLLFYLVSTIKIQFRRNADTKLIAIETNANWHDSVRISVVIAGVSVDHQPLEHYAGLMNVRNDNSKPGTRIRIA